MNLLLDTHVFLWLQTDPERLGESLGIVADERNELLLSAASSLEIAIKHQLGRLPLPEAPERYVPERIREIGAQAISVEHPHALAVAALPPLHRDPFDCLLVAQATLLGLTVVTADPRSLGGSILDTNGSGRIPVTRRRLKEGRHRDLPPQEWRGARQACRCAGRWSQHITNH